MTLGTVEDKSGEASLAGVHFVYNFYEKEDGNYLTHQPSALTQSFFVVVIYFKRGRALFWGGAGKSIMGDGNHGNILF